MRFDCISLVCVCVWLYFNLVCYQYHLTAAKNGRIKFRLFRSIWVCDVTQCHTFSRRKLKFVYFDRILNGAKYFRTKSANYFQLILSWYLHMPRRMHIIVYRIISVTSLKCSLQLSKNFPCIRLLILTLTIFLHEQLLCLNRFAQFPPENICSGNAISQEENWTIIIRERHKILNIPPCYTNIFRHDLFSTSCLTRQNPIRRNRSENLFIVCFKQQY